MSILGLDSLIMFRQQVRSWFITESVHMAPMPIARTAVAAFHDAYQIQGVRAVDDQTWSDLHGDDLIDYLCNDASSYARQVCHHYLRQPASKSVVDLRTAHLQALADDAVAADQVRRIFIPLRHGSTRSFVDLLNEAMTETPVHRNWLRSARIWPFILIAGVLVAHQTAIGLVLMGIFAAGTLYAQTKFHAAMFLFERLTDEILTMLGVATQLVSQQSLNDFPWIGKVQEQRAKIRSMARLFRPALPVGRFSTIEEYANWLRLKNVRTYLKLSPVVREHREWLLHLFENLGELELLAALAEKRRQDYSRFAQVEWAADQQITFNGLTHPLVDQFNPLTIETADRSILITGENGAGKSTAIRAAAVSLLLARAFGFSFARSARLPFRTLITSLQVNDHLLEGESLFYAEVRRAREMWQAAQSDTPPIFFFDEAFRGTSRKESISIGVALLEAISKRSTVFATTHHRELIDLLGDQFDFLLCSKTDEGDTVSFGIGKGVINKPNALTVFEQAGFDASMVARAKSVLQGLDRNADLL